MKQTTRPGPVVGRFAPSPTGAMHLGNARTALLVWLQIRALGGKLIFRSEDLDQGRVRQDAEAGLEADLRWLGLDWDHTVRQSERLEIYQAQLARLDTYSCSCSRKDIQEAAAAPHGQELVYPGFCRQGPRWPDRPLAQRWRVPAQRICVSDLRLGQLEQQLKQEVGDFVLCRNDGVFAYHLAVVVDDGLMGVTHVTRGEDLWESTPRQVALQEALGFPRPVYLHTPLMRDYRGQRLAKRDGAPSVQALRARGVSPQTLLADLAHSLGWKTPEQLTAAELLETYGPRVAAGQI
ncbi:MAG: tRNA glutamyl-Q(34) synthetase GluQRS [Candidatus Sericytochromatia bacterium]